MPAHQQKLVILHTNDIHSRFGQMPRIAAVIKEQRELHAEADPILVDIGDHMDRMFPETEGTMGKANVAVMNAAQYDLAVPGNNEGLTFVPEVLEAAYAERKTFGVLCCNLKAASTGLRPAWLEPYRIIHRGALRVGFIAATAYFPAFYSLLDWEVSDPFEAVQSQVNQLRKQVDVLVLLSHLGLGNDQRMAREVAGLDLILGAHTHHLLEEAMWVGSTAICAAGKFGQHVGVVEMEFDYATRRILQLHAGILAAADTPADEETAALIEDYREQSRLTLAEPAAELSRALPVDWREESPLGNLLAAGIRRWTGADIGIVNAGQLLDGLEPGPVSKGRLLSVCPSPINPCFMMLQGKHLLQALEESLVPDFTDKPIFGFGFRGKVLGTLCVDGIRMECDPVSGRVLQLLINGEPVDPARWYRTGTIDMFTFGIGYLSLAEGKEIRYFLPEFIRDILAVELSSPEAVEASLTPRRWMAES